MKKDPPAADSAQSKQDRQAREEARQFLEDEYERYCMDETDRFIAENPGICARIKETKLQRERKWATGFSLGSTETMASIEAKHEIRKQVPLLGFEGLWNSGSRGAPFI